MTLIAIIETCTCGATFRYSGNDVHGAARRREFAADHQVCRDREPSPPTPALSPEGRKWLEDPAGGELVAVELGEGERLVVTARPGSTLVLSGVLRDGRLELTPGTPVRSGVDRLSPVTNEEAPRG